LNVKNAIEKRRAYRSLEPIEVSDTLIEDLAESARLAQSCFNKQPWRYVFVRDKEQLEKLHKSLPTTNKWVELSSLIIAAFSDVKNDCVIKERQYYLFDTGLASAFIILRATELGLVAHPIAGFNEDGAKRVLGIPEHMRLISLIVIGKRSKEFKEGLTDIQKSKEDKRPERKQFKEFIFIDEFTKPFNKSKGENHRRKQK
jgi:nitroreductase